MAAVIERCLWWPGLGETLVHRDEALILKGPQPPSRRPLPVSHASPPPPAAVASAPTTNERIEVIHAPLAWTERPFSPPLAMYENDDILIEHQDMNGRQPFYHRNTEVDEISYQVSGVRQLVTDIGSVDLEPGDLVKIPVGVAHDNWGRKDIHLLFYVAAPVELALPPLRLSAPHEFRDWSPAIVPERISARGGAVDVLIDEKLLLSGAASDARRLEVANTGGESRLVYQSPAFRLAQVRVARDEGREYRRNLNFDEVQIQLRGSRLLVTEVGCVALEPGDFVRIPAGIAHAGISGGCTYLQVQSAKPLARRAESSKLAGLLSPGDIEAARKALG